MRNHPTVAELLKRDPNATTLINDVVVKGEDGRLVHYGRYNPQGQSFELFPPGKDLLATPAPEPDKPRMGRPPKDREH